MRSKAEKIEMVRLVESSGKSLIQMSQELGIPRTTLMLWCRQFGQAPPRLCLFCQQPLPTGAHGNRRVHEECKAAYQQAYEVAYQESEHGRKVREAIGRRWREKHPTYFREYYQLRRDHYRSLSRNYARTEQGRAVRRRAFKRWRSKKKSDPSQSEW